ncbi:MAG: EAL domain-containing protein [Pyrinomonadaceae bacterium MAG19_C2-C3]|nr:EAL domain-containing protein [Pyrinomonadaceae bacterium MAG19_C2-C3]
MSQAANTHRFTNAYYRLVITAGAIVFLFSAYRLSVEVIDGHFLLLALITISLGARITVRIPGLNGHLSASDTLIFVALLLFGGEAAILLAAAEASCASLRFSKKPRTILFNAGAMACSTFLTVWVLRSGFGSITQLVAGDYTSGLIILLCSLGLLQYSFNSGIVSIVAALKTNQPIWETWRKYYLWTSITYFAGAAAAGVIAKLVTAYNFYALIVSTPIIAIVYFTYQTYLKSVEVSATQAAQAERHVEELSRHIADQKRIGQELQESREHFRHAALHDTLTGLPNRALLKEELMLAIKRANENENSPFAVLFLDLDRFKIINDSLGHAAGDQLLVAIARRLMKCLRPRDTVARLGGDEFAILLQGAEAWSEAANVADRIGKDLMQPFNLSGHEIHTTSSIGIALSTTFYEHPEDILRDADAAMYRAKENGKARYEIFDQNMHKHALDLLQLENDLRRAVEREEFIVHYQPIVLLETKEISGFEALVRWQHPQRGMVSPAEFIPLAEETGLIKEIGSWVLKESCRQLSEWQRQSGVTRPLTLSVNLSGRQFAQPDLVEQVHRILQETGFDPCCLKLEITESVVMSNAENAIRMLTQLRALGIRLSIDDFGTGYSSLSYLHRFPVDTLKIDRSFVNLMGVGQENSEIIRTIKMLAGSLSMETVAEGVETLEQLAQLKALNCEYGQGYLFAKPMEARAAFALLAAQIAESKMTADWLGSNVAPARPKLVSAMAA